MPKRGKRYTDAKAKLSTGDKLPPQDAIQVVKDLSFAKFDETVEVAARLGVDPRQADQVVRGTVVLPHGTGKETRVLVIAQGERKRKPRTPAPISQGARSWRTRSTTDGSSSTPSSPPPT